MLFVAIVHTCPRASTYAPLRFRTVLVSTQCSGWQHYDSIACYYRFDSLAMHQGNDEQTWFHPWVRLLVRMISNGDYTTTRSTTKTPTTPMPRNVHCPNISLIVYIITTQVLDN